MKTYILPEKSNVLGWSEQFGFVATKLAIPTVWWGYRNLEGIYYPKIGFLNGKKLPKPQWELQGENIRWNILSGPGYKSRFLLSRWEGRWDEFDVIPVPVSACVSPDELTCAVLSANGREVFVFDL